MVATTAVAFTNNEEGITTMMGMEWFKPVIFFGSMAYAVMGVVVLDRKSVV